MITPNVFGMLWKKIHASLNHKNVAVALSFYKNFKNAVAFILESYDDQWCVSTTYLLTIAARKTAFKRNIQLFITKPETE